MESMFNIVLFSERFLFVQKFQVFNILSAEDCGQTSSVRFMYVCVASVCLRQ